MGTDTPLAVFSDKPQRLFNYFKQVFAQVTNPPIDSIREELVMTLTSYIGKEGNLLDETPDHCHMVQFKSPIFTNSDVEKHHETGTTRTSRSATLPMTFPVGKAPPGLEKALDRLCQDAEAKIDEGYSFIILSDRGADADNAPIPSLLACSGVHHHLIRVKKRTEVAPDHRNGGSPRSHAFCAALRLWRQRDQSLRRVCHHPRSVQERETSRP